MKTKELKQKYWARGYNLHWSPSRKSWALTHQGVREEGTGQTGIPGMTRLFRHKMGFEQIEYSINMYEEYWKKEQLSEA